MSATHIAVTGGTYNTVSESTALAQVHLERDADGPYGGTTYRVVVSDDGRVIGRVERHGGKVRGRWHGPVEWWAYTEQRNLTRWATTRADAVVAVLRAASDERFRVRP